MEVVLKIYSTYKSNANAADFNCSLIKQVYSFLKKNENIIDKEKGSIEAVV
jgi:hypothetical protein